MANFVAIVGILNVIVDTVKAVEKQSEAAKASGGAVFTGEFKRELAISIIRGVYLSQFPGTEAQFDQMLDGIKSTINTVVSVFNLLGTFRKA